MMRPTDSAFDGWHFPGVLFEVSPHKIMKTNAELMADAPVEGQTQASPSSQEPRLALVEKPNVQFQISDELTRVKIFLGIQAFFLFVSVFTGGFNFKLWSMLDTALMIQSIGVTALVVVLEEARHRRLAFRAAIIVYLLAVLDMGINVLISGVVGWRTP